MAEHAAEPAAPAPTDAGEVRRLIDSQRPFTARAEAGERRGLYVRLGEVRAYAPASALEEAEEPDQLVGRELRFRAIAFAPDGKRVLLTTRPGWPELLRIMERDETAAARIAEVFHSGLQLEIAGVPCFLPVDRIAGFNGSALDEFADRIGSEIDVRLIDLEVQQREAEFIASTDLEHDRAAAAEGKRALAEHRAAGRPIEAEIVQVNERGLVVSVGGAHAFVHANACADRGEDEDPADRVGERIRVAVTGLNARGREVASERAVLEADALAAAWDEVERLRDSGELFEAEAARADRAGVSVDIDGVRGFLPWSLMADRDAAAQRGEDEWAGTVLELRVIEAHRYRNRAIVSESAAAEAPDASAAGISEGDIRTGRVKRASARSVFMDVDGVPGVVPRVEASWLQNAAAARQYQAGDEVAVRVIKADGGASALTLSIRQAAPEPWLDAVAELSAGQVVPATVSTLSPFGAFARIGEAVEGLIHVSELLEREIERPGDAVAIGDVIPVRILEIDPDLFRVALSMRQAVDDARELGWEFDEAGIVTGAPEGIAPSPEADPETLRLQELKRGDEQIGTVLEHRDTGLAIDLDGITGFVSRSEISWLPGVDGSDLAIGDRVRVVVKGVNISGRDVALSIRMAHASEWHAAASEFQPGRVVPAIVREVRRNSAHVAISDRIGAVIWLKELGDEEAEDAAEMVDVGELIPVKLLRINPERQTITASLALAYDEAERLGWEFDEDERVVAVPEDAEPAVQRLRELGSGRPSGEAADEPDLIKRAAEWSPQHRAERGRKRGESDADTARAADAGGGRKPRAERPARPPSLLDEIEEGEIRSGRVAEIRPFGLLVDLGGARGLVHRSELSWRGGVEPEEAAEVGEEVEVHVMKVDRRSKRIGLSLRRVSGAEWDDAASAFSEGDLVPAEITNLVSFGAFARIAPVVEGLIHRTELDDEEVEHPDEIVEPGDLVPVKILKIDAEQFRVTLSLKDAFDPAEAAGWVLDDYGRVERMPDEVAERFGYEQPADGPPVRIPAVE